MTKEIQLTQGKVALVDDEDYEYLSQWKWQYYRGYAKRSEIGTRKHISMHRQIMNVTDKNIQVDHIYHDTLDNRKSQLRLATSQQNNMNRRKAKNNSSGQKGVSLYSRNKKYRAQIEKDNKNMHIGYFYTVEEAAAAYIKKAKELFGEYAAK